MKKLGNGTRTTAANGLSMPVTSVETNVPGLCLMGVEVLLGGACDFHRIGRLESGHSVITVEMKTLKFDDIRIGRVCCKVKKCNY